MKMIKPAGERVRMGGETINGADASQNWNIFTENIHLHLTVDNMGRESPNGCRTRCSILATEFVLEMMADVAAGAHARAGDDDGAAMDALYRNGFGGLPREMQSW